MQNANNFPLTFPIHPLPICKLSVGPLPARTSATMPGASASTTAQYAGIGVAIFIYFVVYYNRSFDTVIPTGQHGGDDDAGEDAGTVLPGPVQALGLGPDDVAVLPLAGRWRREVPAGRGGEQLRGVPRRSPRRRAGAHAAVEQALLPRGVRRRVAAVARDVPDVPGEPGAGEGPPRCRVPVAADPAASPARGGGVAR